MTTEKRIQRTEAGIHNVMSSVCAKASVNPWQEQWSRKAAEGITHSVSATGKWEQSERGEVFVRSFPVFFFLICLPRHVSTCQQYARERKKNLSMGSLCCFLQVKEKTSLELKEDSQA